MKYWVSYSVFQVLEYFADLTVAFVMPFYLELKLCALMWLVHMRASSLIDSAVDKELKKREKNIDRWLKKLNNEFVGVFWFQFSRVSVKILTFLLKSIAASHHIKLSDEPSMDVDDCDTSNNNNDDQLCDLNREEDDRNRIEYDTALDSLDIPDDDSRIMRDLSEKEVKRELLSLG